jgi:hypothetical protein
MNTENEMNEEVRQLLDSLEEHGKNARRQQDLSDLIDRLADEEKTVAMPRKHRTLTPLWWAMGAAAACLLLWLLVKPNAKQQPEMEQEILVEETKTVDSVKTEVNDAVFEQPVANETLLAEETPIVPQNAPMKKEKPKTQIIEKVVEQPMLVEVKPTEPKDTTNIGSNTIPTENETPSAVQKPQRRVIRSLNLVCYECQKDPEFFTKPVTEDRTLFGQPQDPNMKNGSLALEIKLN